jgi:O-antigen/teichoic acid export membrane protein
LYLFASFGIGGGVNTILMNYRSEKSRGKGKLLRFLLKRMSITSFLAIFFIVLASLFFENVLNDIFILSAFFFIVILKILIDISSAFLRCSGYDVYGVVLDSLLRPLVFLILIFTVNIYLKLNFLSIILLLTLSFLLVYFIGVAPLILSIIRKNKLSLKSSYSYIEKIKLQRNANMFMVITFSQVASRHLDIIFIGAVLSSSSVAVYVVGAKIAAIGSFILLAATSVIAPRISSLRNEGIERLNKELYANNRFASLVGGAVTLVVCFCAEPFINYFFGQNYHKAINIIYILSLAEFILVLLGDSSIVMNMLGMASKNAKWLIVNVILQSTLIICISSTGGLILMVVAISFVRCFYKVFLLIYLRKQGIYVSCLDPQNWYLIKP